VCAAWLYAKTSQGTCQVRNVPVRKLASPGQGTCQGRTIMPVSVQQLACLSGMSTQCMSERPLVGGGCGEVYYEKAVRRTMPRVCTGYAMGKQ